jgi:RNA polymerase sigma-70 factor (ECF subfamily)
MDFPTIFLLVGALADGRLSARQKLFATQLYTGYLPLIRRCIGRMTGPGDDCESLVQDTFVRLLEHIDRLIDLPAPQLTRYVRRVAESVCIDYRRRLRPTLSFDEYPEAVLPDETSFSESVFEQKELLDSFSRQYEQLSRTDQELLYLRYILELSVQEIADRLGIRENSARVALYRARQHAREKIRLDMEP